MADAVFLVFFSEGGHVDRRKGCQVKAENWGDPSPRQGTPGIAKKPPEVKKGQGSLRRFQRERGPADLPSGLPASDCETTHLF